MFINVVEKLVPTAAKAIGWKGALEIAALASIGAEGLNLVVNKGTEFAKSKLDGQLEKKKQELIQTRAALQAAKEQATAEVTTEETQETEAEVEKKEPVKASKKKNK